MSQQGGGSERDDDEASSSEQIRATMTARIEVDKGGRPPSTKERNSGKSSTARREK